MIRARETKLPADRPGSERARIRWRRTVFFCVLASGLAASSPAVAASQLDLQYSEWGFDDRAVPRKFNLLSLEIRNRTAKPFEGNLQLRRMFGSTAAGAPLVQPIYLGPFQRRIVQFTPYVFDQSDEWEVRWGRSLEESYTVEAARLGIGARVIFNDPVATSGLTSGLRGFREDRFPASVIATDSLLCVVMDHAPRWEKLRRKVFRDWLYRGGVLHVLLTPDGEYPKLPVEELNTGERPTRFGSGRVYWHDKRRGQLHDNREFVYREIYSTAPVAVPITDLFGEDTTDVDPTSLEFTRQLGTNSFLSTYAEWDSDIVIPFSLRDFVQAQTEHSWPVIYLLALTYLLLIFPGGPWLAKKLDYRLNLLALLVVVTAWSWFYWILGARGSGEATSTQSLAIAKPLPDGRWDVEQWSGFFATAGDEYALTHQGESRAYSALIKDGASVDGHIDNGKDGRFVVDVPPFTSRTMAHRAVVEMPGPRIQVLDAKWSGASLRQISLQFEQDFPTTVRSAFVIAGGRIHPIPLNLLSGQPTLTLTNPQPNQRLLDIQPGFSSRVNYARDELNRISDDIAFQELLPTMLARDIGIRLFTDRDKFRLPADVVRLCVYADLPDELSCRDSRNPEQALGIQKGRVLYSIDLPVSPPQSARERIPKRNQPGRVDPAPGQEN